MDLNLKDINGVELKLGDPVRILKITDDSGSAVHLYGVESQLDGWIENVYIEEFEGVIKYDEITMMIVISGNYTNIPLSPIVRYDIWNQRFDCVNIENKEEVVKEFNIGYEYDDLINFIEKIHE